MFGKNLEITPTEAIFLLVLKKQDSISGSEIVESISSNLGSDWVPTPGATYKIIRSLENKGFIEETTGSEGRKDQRIRTYSLSSAGKSIVPKVSERFRKVVLFMDSCCPGCCDGIIVIRRKKT
ncbi:PadR family transcriptional regulator [Candidatus Lokiarchaeum ossiferum]